jgi:LmbE family N-acetylglucosaminyl deacetylase
MSTNPLLSNRKTRWIFLSPHLDDAVYSCGGLISYLSENGIAVEIWTIFSDQEPDESLLTEYAQTLHQRWETGNQSYNLRKIEDTIACKTVGAKQEHLGFYDCIYRTLPKTGKPVVSSNEDLFGRVDPAEEPLMELITEAMLFRLTEPSIWVCPLGVGNHIDHQITRQAAEATRKLMLYYADLPHAIQLPVQGIPGMIQLKFDLPESNINTWGKANLQYISQFSSFWRDAEDMAAQYSTYLERYKGMPLWLPKPAV